MEEIKCSKCRKLYAYMSEYFDEKGYMPSRQELREFTQSNDFSRYINKLVASGYLRLTSIGLSWRLNYSEFRPTVAIVQEKTIH